MRPFILGAKVSPRGCSRPLQRAITDFAADHPFALVPLKLREHYGFEIGESTIQRVTLGHAQAIFESGRPSAEFPKESGLYKQIVAQTDGGMIPVMEPDAEQKDKRKGKKLAWKEAKISLAHAKGSRTPVYGGGIEGGVDMAGRRLFDCAVRAGFGAESRVHAVGDGAPWIVGQIEERFGDQGSYLIDFYHEPLAKLNVIYGKVVEIYIWSVCWFSSLKFNNNLLSFMICYGIIAVRPAMCGDNHAQRPSRRHESPLEPHPGLSVPLVA